MLETTQENEIHEAIAKIRSELIWSLSGTDFNNVVLGLLLYRFASEKVANYLRKNLTEEEAEREKEQCIAKLGYFMLPSELFEHVQREASSYPKVAVELIQVFKNIEHSADGTRTKTNIKGLFTDVIVSINKITENKSIINVLQYIQNLQPNLFASHQFDIFGDAYEYLMKMQDSNSLKEAGEFYTPPEVSKLLAKISLHGNTKVEKVYDPTCGSGSLLLKFSELLGKENITTGLYGQERNITTYNLCRINMFLHDISYKKFKIVHGDTLMNPKLQEEAPFDCIVANPPFSVSWAGDSDQRLTEDPRFKVVGKLAPKSKADLAFILHSLSMLSEQGTAAIVCFPGVLYRGGAEQVIRKYLVDNNYVDAVIHLPEQLFFNTSIGTCILVLKKNKEDSNILYIDATKEYEKSGDRNKLSNMNIEKILNAIRKLSLIHISEPTRPY